MPLRVLQIVATMNRGGLETMLMNYYRHIDRDKIQFDFLVHRQEEGDYEKEILSLGGRIYRVPALNPFSPAYFKALNQFFSEHNYSVVHSHLDCMSAVPLSVAKKHGIKHRFAHAHNKSQDKNWKFLIKLIFKKLTPLYATRLFACGKEAGDWMFDGKAYTLLNNAIDSVEYSYNHVTRLYIRKKLGINNEFVICHVGRFNPQKNHVFLINIFKELLNNKPNSKLLLIGDGDGIDLCKAEVEKLGIDQKVLFLGKRTDVSQLLQAADLFLFPSLYEGVSLACIEAQAAGLPCILSDSIPSECKITDDVRFISLNSNYKFWSDVILNFNEYERQDRSNIICQSGYDINLNAGYLQNLYAETEQL